MKNIQIFHKLDYTLPTPSSEEPLFFIEEKGKVLFQNASQVALRTFQDEMTGEAEKVGFKSEDDVIRYIKDLRKNEGK